MSGPPPGLFGAVHATSRLPAFPGTVVTLGSAGCDGDSSTSVTVTTIVCLLWSRRSPVPLRTRTTTTYSLFPAALTGLVLSKSHGASKFGEG